MRRLGWVKMRVDASGGGCRGGVSGMGRVFWGGPFLRGTRRGSFLRRSGIGVGTECAAIAEGITLL